VRRTPHLLRLFFLVSIYSNNSNISRWGISEQIFKVQSKCITETNAIVLDKMQNDRQYHEEFQPTVIGPCKSIFFAVGFKNWEKKAERDEFRKAITTAKQELDSLDLGKSWTKYNQEEHNSFVTSFRSSLMETFKCVSRPCSRG
jgi:hypothetical protein